MNVYVVITESEEGDYKEIHSVWSVEPDAEDQKRMLELQTDMIVTIEHWEVSWKVEVILANGTIIVLDGSGNVLLDWNDYWDNDKLPSEVSETIAKALLK